MDRVCKECGKKLIDFRTTKDWDKRKYHKTCWHRRVERLTLEEMAKSEKPKPVVPLFLDD